MFKFLGIILIIFSGTMSGYTKSIKVRDKVFFIQKYMEFITFVINEIKYNRSELTEILNKFYSTGKFYSYIQICREHIEKGYIFPEAWKMSFNNVAKEMGISYEKETSIIDFGVGLGDNDVDTQISHCKYYYEYIRPYFNSLLKEKTTKFRLYIVVGTCLGATIALLFV